MRAPRVALAAIALAAATLAGCGGGMRISLFTTEWVDDGGKSIEAVRQRLAKARPAIGADVVVGVGSGVDKVIGEPLAGGAKWTFAHALDARPLVTGSIVVGTGGGELFALDATTGKRLWARPTGGLKVHGAGDDGEVTVVTMSSGTGLGSTLLAVARDGKVLQQLETERVLGTPAVLGGFVGPRPVA